MFFHFSFLPVFPWTHSGPLVLMTLSKGGADLLIFLTLFLPSHPGDLRQDASGPVVLPLCNFSPTLPHRICSHYPSHNKDWASCFKTLHPTFWGLFFFLANTDCFSLIDNPGSALLRKRLLVLSSLFQVRTLHPYPTCELSIWFQFTTMCNICRLNMKTEMELSLSPNENWFCYICNVKFLSLPSFEALVILGKMPVIVIGLSSKTEISFQDSTMGSDI